MPGAKGHLNEDPNEISGTMTVSGRVRRQVKREREERRRRQAERQQSGRR